MADNFFTLWPFLLLFLASLRLVPLLMSAPRWRERSWWLSVLLPIYAVHQFEENGLDLFARRFQFHVSLCNWFGYYKAEVALCPADAPFLFVVNVVEGGLLLLLAFLCGPRRPLASCVVFGVAFINAITHIGATLVHFTYYPGLVTAILLLLPLAISFFREALLRLWVTPQQLLLALAAGAYAHVMLLTAVKGMVEGWMDPRIAMILQIFSGFIPLTAFLYPSKHVAKFAP